LWSKRRKYDIEAEHIYTLSQKLVAKEGFAYLRDYALNLNSRDIAILDYLIEKYKDYPLVVAYLKDIRNLKLKIGEAEFLIEKGDILTHLGLKLGKSGVVEINGIETDESE